MLTKCAEAAGLREAFPDEVGGIATEEEMDGQRAITVQATTPAESTGLATPEGYDEWMSELVAAANAGGAKLSEAWKGAKPPMRQFLMATEPESWDSLKARGDAVDAAAVQVGEVVS
jgi:hypothetical protein